MGSRFCVGGLNSATWLLDKIMPTSMTKFVVFSRVDFVGFGCVAGCFLYRFLMFTGLATTDREKPRYVKFVDRIEKLVDFREN